MKLCSYTYMCLDKVKVKSNENNFFFYAHGVKIAANT